MVWYNECTDPIIEETLKIPDKNNYNKTKTYLIIFQSAKSFNKYHTYSIQWIMKISIVISALYMKFKKTIYGQIFYESIETLNLKRMHLF